MQSGYYNTTGGMVTQFSRLELISNNLANLNTTGFKRDDVVVGDFLRLYETAKEQLPLQNHTKEAARFINRTMDRVPIIVEEFSDAAVGSVAATENALDFALSAPNAFFAVATPSGVRYTRDGSFSLNEEGEIVTKDGFKVLSAAQFDSIGENYDFSAVSGISVPPNSVVEVTPNGSIFARGVANDVLGEGALVGSFAVVSFENPRFLRKMGGNFYEFPRERDNERSLNLRGVVRQGFLEKSNVNAVREMTALIETNRLVDMYQKVMRTHMDEMNNEAISKLAVRA